MPRYRAFAASASALVFVLASPVAASADTGGGCTGWTVGAERFRVCISSVDHKVRPDYYLDRLAAPAPGETCHIRAWLSREWSGDPRRSVPYSSTWEWSKSWKPGHYKITLGNPQSYGRGNWQFGIEGVCTARKGKPTHGWNMRYAPEQVIN